MGERLFPLEFTPQCHQLRWLVDHLAGWQFGEQGLIDAIADKLAITKGTVIEYGAGDGENLPVTLSRFHRRLGMASIYVEIEEAKRVALQQQYPLAAVVRDISWDVFHDARPAIVVIDIDGSDSVVMREMLQAGVRPALLVVEHFDNHYPIGTSTPDPFPQWALGLTLSEGHVIQDTAETLQAIAAKFGYERIGWNRCNSFFVRRELYTTLFR